MKWLLPAIADDRRVLDPHGVEICVGLDTETADYLAWLLNEQPRVPLSELAGDTFLHPAIHTEEP